MVGRIKGEEIIMAIEETVILQIEIQMITMTEEAET